MPGMNDVATVHWGSSRWHAGTTSCSAPRCISTSKSPPQPTSLHLPCILRLNPVVRYSSCVYLSLDQVMIRDRVKQDRNLMVIPEQA